MKAGLWFRSLLPLLLVGACLLVWFERFITPLKVVTDAFGGDFFVRFTLGFLCLYVLLLWGENMRMNAMLTSVLTALQDFAKARRAEIGTEGKRLEAVRLLVAAMASADPSVRASSRQHLARLCGKDLGEDAGAWQCWLQEQEAQQAQGPGPG